MSTCMQPNGAEKSGRGGGRMTAKMDLGDLLDMFSKTEEKPLPDSPISPEARRWRKVFAAGVEAVLRARDVPRVEAERVAFANTVTAFLNATHSSTLSDRCAHCGVLEIPGDPLKPIGWGVWHAWLHDRCWEEWRLRRRAEAIKALAEAGVSFP